MNRSEILDVIARENAEIIKAAIKDMEAKTCESLKKIIFDEKERNLVTNEILTEIFLEVSSKLLGETIGKGILQEPEQWWFI